MVDKLSDVLKNNLRGIIFKVLTDNASYNQGKIATETLSQIIPLVRTDCQREIGEWLEGNSSEDGLNIGFYSNPHYNRCIHWTKWDKFIDALKSGTFGKA